MARNLPRQGRSRRYGNMVPRSPAGPMDIGRSLRGPHPGPPAGGGRGFGPGKRVQRAIQGPGGLGGKNAYGRPLPNGMVQTPEGPKPAPRPGGHLPGGPGKGPLHPAIMAQIQFLREAKQNLNLHKKQEATTKQAGGTYSGPPAPLRQAARGRINTRLAQLRAESANSRKITEDSGFRKQPRRPRGRKAYNTFT